MGQTNTNSNWKKETCDNYSWDAMSAGKKFMSNSNVTLGVPGVASMNFTTPPNNDSKNAYKNCGNCGHHKNFHK